MPSSTRCDKQKMFRGGKGTPEDSDEDYSWTPGGSEKSPTKATWEISMGSEPVKDKMTPPPPPLLPYSRPVPQWMVEEAACTLTPTTPDAGLTSSPLTGNNSIIDSVDNQLSSDLLDDVQTPPTTPRTIVPGLLELQTVEAEERAHIEAQVTTRKKFLHSLIMQTESLYFLKALLPDTLWNHDYLRLALVFAVMRGDIAVVSYIVSSAFRGYHTIEVANSYVHPKLLEELGLRQVRGVSSFIQLAVMQMVCDVEEQLYEGPKGAALKADREEIFKLLITARGMCCLEGDVEAMQHGASVVGGLLEFWSHDIHNISCSQSGCSASRKRSLVWAPDVMHMFPTTFFSRVKCVCSMGVAKQLDRDLVRSIVVYMSYSENGGKKDVNYPAKKTVADVIDGRIEVLDGSVEVMKKYSQHCKGTTPVPGLRVVATITTVRGPQCMTGHLTGVLDDMLHWRPLNASCSEPLTGVFFLNPLANQADLDITGDCWLCGMCMLLNSKSMEKCRRCYNTHQGALTLEGQRKKQNVNSTSMKHQQRVRMQYQRQPAWAPPMYDRVMQPFTAINLSAVPPRHEVFETADVRLAPYRVRSGQVVATNGIQGVVIGLGKDESLYWMIEGARGATRLALTPEALHGIMH
eukprot:TRINITY_DN2772_c0_g2_i1.p1 TRINITY_DN2772_c0_g2~~TRINITY_DN2772_c0_g2_i1.p1  ORF type:complete len:633 (+),score=165.03 TRINITY_DN2772_c0_g2_i1:37-1935(+)